MGYAEKAKCLKRRIGLIALCIVGFLLPTEVYRLPVSSASKLVIDAEIEDGTSLSIFLNSDYTKSPSRPIVPGRRVKYIFDDIDEPIRQLRIDPTDIPNTRFQIYKIRLVHHGKVLYEANDDKLASAQVIGAVPTSQGQKVFAFRSSSNDPIIVTTLSYSVSWLDRILLKLGTTPTEFALNFAYFCLILSIAVGIFRSSAAHFLLLWPVVLLPVLGLFEHYIAVAGLKLIETPLSFENSIGISSYSGRPKGTESWTFIVMAVVAGALGACSFILFRHKNLPARELDERNKFSLFFPVGMCVAIAVFTFPNLQESFQQIPNMSHAPDWDSQAILHWQYQANRGAIPFKDYWFPYGGFWNMLSPFPWDLLRFYLYKTVVYSVFSVCVYYLTGFRRLYALTILGSTLLFEASNYFQGLYRYLLSVDTVLLYLCLLLSRTNSLVRYAFFGVFCGWVFFYEPTQLFYSSLPIFTVFSFELLFGKDPRSVSRRIFLNACAALVVLSAAIIFLLKLSYLGQLEGWMRFYSQLSAMAGSSSTPAAIEAWNSLSRNPENIVQLGTLFLVFWGSYLLVLTRRESTFRKYSYVVISLGLLSFMIYMKHIVRPHMARQFWVIPFLAFALFLSEYSGHWNRLQKSLGALAVGGLLCFAHQAGLISHLYHQYGQSALSLVPNARTLFIDPQAMKAQQDTFFSSRLFTEKSSAARELYSYLTKVQEGGEIPSIYVLGDQVYIYIMCNKNPPPYTSVYDGGTLQAQKVNIAWLEQTQPELVIWNSDSQTFDGVPNVIRVPLLFEYVMTNYTYKDTVGKFLIFKRKTSESELSLDTWAKYLGTSVDVNAIARSPSFRSLFDCDTTPANTCHDYLVIKSQDGKGDALRTIHLALEGRPYSVQFRQVPDVSEYFIDLDRVWFWVLGKKIGAQRSLSPTQATDLTVSIQPRAANPDILY